MLNISIDTDPEIKGLNDNQSIKIVTHTLNSEEVASCNISIIFGSKELLRNLKKKYFQVDQTTDVIAFRLNDYSEKNIEGEIYICLPVAKENAEFYNEPYEKEIARLIIHGTLHLIGYDDDSEDNRYKMQQLENYYLKELKF